MIPSPTRPVWSEGADGTRRPVLDEHVTADVAIVGAGYSGLWLAHSLVRLDPDLAVVVVERDRVGFGASGRNGGWVSALLPTSLRSISECIGDEATVRLQTEMFAAVREIGSLCTAEGIDCDYRMGGSLALVRNEQQRRRALGDLDDYQNFGFGDHIELLDTESTRIRISSDSESVFRPDCAAVHPRRLVDGLARAVERRGVRVFESSPALLIRSGEIRTDRGGVRARFVVDCREAFGAAASRRRIVPIYSLMIATEPLPDETWASIGLHGHETFTDHRHQLVYGQRTADGRLAFGGRGVGYHFGSRVDDRFENDDRVHAALRASMNELFPVLEDIRITHRWGGPLAAPRDWMWTVSMDDVTGLGVTGGYVGDGVTSAFVAGRAMAGRIVEGESDFPLFGHRSRRWEPEPMRWIGINAMSRLADRLDRRERAGRSAGLLGRVFERLVG